MVEYATGLSIRLHDVAAAPGGVPVLTGIDLVLAAGGRTVLVGPNGAGKSTLLLHLNGLLPGKGTHLHAHGSENGQHAAARALVWIDGLNLLAHGSDGRRGAHAKRLPGEAFGDLGEH